MLRFGVFELDPVGGELRKNGFLIKLPPQPFQVLRLLVENAGQLQTREDLRRAVWGAETFVDFDRGLNVCIAQVRAALGDDSETPRFIQTVPRRGYRFVSPVERVGAGHSAAILEVSDSGTAPRQLRFGAGIALALVAAAAGYLVWHRSATSARTPATTPALMSPGRVMLAALPFEYLSLPNASLQSSQAKDELLLDGLTEELISQLGSVHPARLGVIARTSVMRYKAAPRSVDQIGRELKVDYVVEGTLRRDAGRLRLTARLIRVADQGQVWNETLDSEESRALELQQEAAARIAAGIVRQLFPNTAVSARRIGTEKTAAREAYRNGRYLQHKGTRADLERSVPQLEQAIRLDASFGEAHAALADAHVSLARSGVQSGEHFTQAGSAARRAISLDTSLAEAHNALANVALWHEWQWSEAERHFARAIEINPSFAAAQHDYAWFLVVTGHTEQGLGALRRAMALDPLSTRVNIDAGWVLLQAHRFEEAARQARRALELEPGLAEAHACLSRALLFLGRHDEAMQELLQVLPPSPLRARLASLPPQEGIREYYRERLRQAARITGADPYRQALNHAQLNEREPALDALERSYQSHSAMLVTLKTEPAFAPLQREPRFQQLLRNLGLP